MMTMSRVGPSTEAILGPTEEAQNEATFSRQLKATIIRNLLRKRRNYRQTLSETLTPTYYLFLVVLMKLVIPNPTFPAILSPSGAAALTEPFGANSSAKINIGVAPRNQQVETFMQNALASIFLEHSAFNVMYFEEEKLMENATGIELGVIFELPPDEELRYKIRTLGNLPSSEIRNNDGTQCRLSESDFLPQNELFHCQPTNYYYSGFLSFQSAIDLTWIEQRTTSSSSFQFPKEIILELAPKLAMVGSTVTILRSIIPLYLLISLGQLVGPMLQFIVEEKEKKIKESMKMVGLRGSVFWLSWFFVYSIIVLVIALVASAIMAGIVLDQGNFLVLFLLTFEFGLSMIMFAFILTTLFSKAKVAATVGGLATVMVAALYYLQVFVNGLPNYVFWLFALLSPPAYAMAIDQMMLLDSQNAPIDLWNDSQGIPIGGVMIMIAVDIILYGLLAAWLDNILPTEYGTRRAPWFCLQPSYWIRRNAYAISSGHETNEGLSRASSPANVNDSIFEGPDIENIPEELKNTEALVIANLHKTFTAFRKEPVQAVKGISLKIYPNEITAILGHNGAGKTTLFNMLTGMTATTSGTANICGYDVQDPNQLEEIRKMTGICPQHDILFDELTTKEHLQFFARIRGVPEASIEEAVSGIIKEVDLVEKTEVVAKKLSGGQKRKLSVGIALIGDPKIIFLDEPTAGVDPYSRRHIWSLLKQKKEGKVILLTTHFMDEADLLADRKAILSHGELRCYGSSLFLKNRFGLGYTLTMVLKPNALLDEIAQLIQRQIPKATKNRLFGRELSYILPRDHVDRFSRLFHDIEAEIHAQGRLGIDSFGTSMPTLEEVFLSLGEAEGDHGEGQNQQTEEHQIVGYGFDPVATKKTIWQTFQTLVKLRILNKFREPGSVITQMIIPVLYSIFGLWITSIQSTVSTIDEPLNITSSTLYPDRNYGYQNFSGTPLTFFESGMNNPDYIPSDVNFSQLVNFTKPMAFFNFSTSLEDGLNLTLIADDRSSHVLPVAINDLNNAIASHFGLPRINLTSQPFKPESLSTFFDGTLFAGSMFLGFTYVVMAVGLAMELIYDREIRAKNQLRVNGLGFYMYFGSFYTVLGGMMLILCGCLLILAKAFDLKSLTLGPAFPIFATLYLIFPIPGILFTSTISYAFDSIQTGQMLFGAATFFGFIPYIIVFMLKTFEALIKTPNVALIAHVLCSFVSPLYIPFGIISFLGFKYFECSAFQTCDQLTFMDYISEPEIYSLYLACIFHTIFWFGALKVADVVKDGGKVSSAFTGKKTGSNATSHHCEEQPESYYSNPDEDVMQEKAQIQEYFQNGGSDRVVAIGNLSKVYNGEKAGCGRKKKAKKSEKVAVQQVSFGVNPGEVFGLLGPNGAGKTTTIKLIAAEEHPTRGAIKISKHLIESNDSPGFELLGYCPQFDALWKRVTVREHLETYAAIRGVSPKDIPRVCQQIMKGLRIEEHAQKHAEKCSGGTKRKLSYGMAMLGDPKIVLLDEPTCGMDPQSKRFVWDTILASFKNERGAILTTHSMEEADALCNRVGIMVKGELRCLGSTQHLKNKYGAGYVLDIKCHGRTTRQNWEALHEDILALFDPSGVKLDEAFADRRTYAVTQSAVASLGDVFDALQTLKQQHDIEEYSFSQTTLEQVFIKFAKEQDSIED